jgi:hypothetical protein
MEAQLTVAVTQQITVARVKLESQCALTVGVMEAQLTVTVTVTVTLQITAARVTTRTHRRGDGGGLVAHGDDDKQHPHGGGGRPDHGPRCAAGGGAGGHLQHPGDHQLWCGEAGGQGPRCPPLLPLNFQVHACAPLAGVGGDLEREAPPAAGEQGVPCDGGVILSHQHSQQACRGEAGVQATLSLVDSGMRVSQPAARNGRARRDHTVQKKRTKVTTTQCPRRLIKEKAEVQQTQRMNQECRSPTDSHTWVASSHQGSHLTRGA